MKLTFLYECAQCGKRKEVVPGVPDPLMKEFDASVNADLWVTLAKRQIRLHRCLEAGFLVYGIMKFIGFVVREDAQRQPKAG